MGVTEAKRLKGLDQESARLKKLIRDLSLDKYILQAVIEKKLYGSEKRERSQTG